MATARLDIRLDKEIKAKAEKASALLGLKSFTEYVVRLMDEDASHVIAEHEIITVEKYKKLTNKDKVLLAISLRSDFCQPHFACY